ncbi:MAG: GMC family oxidoreductase [Duganella sp.]
MIISSTDIDAHRGLEAAICIVGAGAAGITLACELDGTGIPVLLLESGGLAVNAALDDDYAGQANAPHPDTTQFRRATFGGTTGIWGGRCVPYDPIDFQARDYIPNSGWPIAYEEVAQHYPRAMAYCDAGAADFCSDTALPGAPATIASLRDNDILLADRIERYSLPTDFGKRYRQQLEKSANVTVVLNARCIDLLRSGDSDRVSAITVADASGRRLAVHAEQFVLATGGIEVPRLLLHAERNGQRFGNSHDLVGRYYACHFENILGKVTADTKLPFKFEKTADGVYSRRKLQFSAQAQRQHRLLNTAFRFHFPEYSDATHGSAVMSTIFLAKSILIPEYRAILQHNAQGATSSPALQHWKNVIKGAPQLLHFGAEWLFLRKLAQRKLPYTLVPNADGSYPLEFNCEQTPLADSRIQLGEQSDRHGMRRVQVDWRISEDDIDATHRGFLLLRDTLHQCSGVRLHLDDATLRERIAASVPLGGHHIGTARMASSASEGVVDANCAVFDVPNLFIASSAVLPTSSHANPTLTIVALAVRLAAHLKASRRTA